MAEELFTDEPLDIFNDGNDNTEEDDLGYTEEEDEEDVKLSRRARKAAESSAMLAERDRRIAELESKTKIVDQLVSDPNKFLNDLAAELGQKIGAPASQLRSSNGLSQDEIELAQGALSDSPDMQFLAPHVAKVAKALVERELNPIKQERQREAASRRQEEFNNALSQLNDKSPGWDVHKEEMTDVIKFLERASTGGPLTHPKHGTIAEMVLRIVQKDDQATALAAQRLAKAGKNRVSSGSSAPSGGPSIAQQIGKASSLADKMKIAFNAALSER